MASVQADTRSEARKRLDEMIASEPPLPAPDLPPGAQACSAEHQLAKIDKRPVAVVGIVENGLVRPIDPKVKLPEHARVVIVAARAMHSEPADVTAPPAASAPGG